MENHRVKVFSFDRGGVYLQMVKMSAKIQFTYRSNVWFQFLSVLVQIYLLQVIWTDVYQHQGQSNPIQLHALIAYLTLTNLQTWVLQPQITDVLQRRISTGEVALDIVKPVNFLVQLLLQQFGFTLGLLPLVLCVLPFAFLVGAMQLPVSVAALGYYLLSFLFSYAIATFIGILIGLAAMWILEITGILLIYRFINQLFAGALVPLWFFPSALRALAAFLPFQAIAFLPASIYLGTISQSEVWRVLGIQTCWLCLLYGLTHLVWHKVRRRVMLQGG